jgi:hypothetical protein
MVLKQLEYMLPKCCGLDRTASFGGPEARRLGVFLAAARTRSGRIGRRRSFGWEGLRNRSRASARGRRNCAELH